MAEGLTLSSLERLALECPRQLVTPDGVAASLTLHESLLYVRVGLVVVDLSLRVDRKVMELVIGVCCYTEKEAEVCD